MGSVYLSGIAGVVQKTVAPAGGHDKVEIYRGGEEMKVVGEVAYKGSMLTCDFYVDVVKRLFES